MIPYWQFHPGFLLLIVWPREWEQSRMEKEKEQFRMQFREWILLLSSSLTAGYSVENAFGQSLRELGLMFPGGGAMLEALQEMVLRAENNQRPEQLLKDLAEKHPLEEVESFVEVFCTARTSGGSLNGNYPADSRARWPQVMDTRREIRTFLAAKVYEQRIMMVMPAGVLFYIRMGSGEFVEALYHNLSGVLIMTVCLIVYARSLCHGKKDGAV